MEVTREKTIALIKADIEHLGKLAAEPTIARGPASCLELNVCREVRGVCHFCVYQEGTMNGGCCLGLDLAMITARSEYNAGRMSAKRFVHRVQTLQDWLTRKLDEVENGRD